MHPAKTHGNHKLGRYYNQENMHTSPDPLDLCAILVVIHVKVPALLHVLVSIIMEVQRGHAPMETSAAFYPQSLNESLECSYRIYPSETTCALKIDFERFEMRRAKRYTKNEKCVDDIMFILNTAGGATEGVCEMENHTAQSSNVSWSLKINQVNCKSMQPWKNLPTCGRQLMFEPNEYDSDTQLAALENPLNEARKPVQSPQAHPYIVNGKDAETSEFPWQVSLQLHTKSTHRCGGSILNERNAYTSKSKMKIIVGDYILDTEKDGEHEEFEIEKIVVHYNYKPTESHVNDIAVIKLKETIKFNDKVQPICLPNEDTEVYNKNAIVSGWGRLNGTDPAASASRLQKLDVKIIMNEQCKELVKKEYEEVLKRNLSFDEVAKASVMGISETQLCGLSKPGTSVCFGDSGGPLIMQNDEDGRYFQVGVVSYGLGKCRTDRQIPGSYTNVRKYLNFISIATMEP
ncbi:Serine proteinase stubble [Orchesella cincta]|uniref:Serine proteinase stubble n=1 Tax=Orchesella cincta TaxID=48709 RepID=A0A1D2N6T5_ORCCI|nr:Serine proteinase stubble [Orchesella cincta]